MNSRFGAEGTPAFQRLILKKMKNIADQWIFGDVSCFFLMIR